MDDRKCLEKGSRLILGDTEYEIGEMAGKGSNAIVYKAAYKDGIEKEHYHHVLIKELFPWQKEGGIYREEDGSIFCRPEKKEFFEMHGNSFREGNRIHLSYLEAHPEAAAGNINSWYQKGTIYTVYSFEGGITLEEWREKENPDLETLCRFMEKLTDAAESFYQSGFLHLDISPDNILAVPGAGALEERVLLIDFNCAWNRKGREKDISVYTGKKEGYSAPEVLLGRTEYFDQCSDLYSICAVFFFLLTGRRMEKKEQRDKKIRIETLEQCSCLGDIPQTAMHLLKRILCRGLSLSPAVRYQTGQELKRDIRELEDRLEGRGITREALWEISRGLRINYEKQIQVYGYNCHTYLGTEQNQKLAEENFWEEIAEKKANALVLGEGGAGKTGILFRAWKKGTEKYNPSSPVVFFIPLSLYTGKEEGEKFLQSYILEKIRQGYGREQEEFLCLSRVLEFEGPFVFLLDGLNEAVKRQRLLKEIQELSRKKGVQIILSDRKNFLGKGQKENFRIYTVSGLAPDEQEQICRQSKAAVPKDQELKELLENRMFMGMYLEVAHSSVADSSGEKKDDIGAGKDRGLFERYYRVIQEKAKETLMWEEEESFAAGYALEHLLPRAALESEKRKSRLLKNEVMVEIAEQSYRQLKEKAFLLAFPEYMGKGAGICAYFKGFWEWYDFTVNRLLSDELKLLQKSEEGWSISHQILCRYLGERGNINRNAYIHSRWKQRLKNHCRTLFIAGVLCVAAFGIWSQSSYPFFPGDKAEVKESIANMALVTGCTYYILEEGYSILEDGEDMIAEGFGEGDYEYWHSQMEKRMEDCSSYAELYEKAAKDRYLPLAENLRMDLNKEELKDLYTSPGNFYRQMGEYLENLSVRLTPGTGHTDRSRQEAVKAVREYLDAYTSLLNWTTASVLKEYPQEYRQQYGGLLQEYPLYRSISENQEKIQTELKNAEKALEETQRELRLEGMGR